jgi:hypothetical protein
MHRTLRKIQNGNLSIEFTLSCTAAAMMHHQAAQSTTARHHKRQMRVKRMHNTHAHPLLHERSNISAQAAAVQNKGAFVAVVAVKGHRRHGDGAWLPHTLGKRMKSGSRLHSMKELAV